MDNVFEILVLPRLMIHVIQRCYLHPVKLQIVYDELELQKFDIEWQMKYTAEGDENCDMELTQVTSNADLMAAIKKKITALTWDSVVFPVFKLTGFSQKTGNTDNRGGGCGNLKIDVDDFEYTIINSTGVTLRNLTEVIYRLKGSKYDWWYEIYSTFVEENRSDNSVLIEVKFGYGS